MVLRFYVSVAGAEDDSRTLGRSLPPGQVVGGGAAWPQAQGPGRGRLAARPRNATPKGARRRSLAALTKEARGVVDFGIADLASNPEHLKGFGGHAGRHR